MKAYNDQEVQSDVRTIDPNAIEPAHLPFELHVTSLALINEQRKRDQRKEKFKNAKPLPHYLKCCAKLRRVVEAFGAPGSTESSFSKRAKTCLKFPAFSC